MKIMRICILTVLICILVIIVYGTEWRVVKPVKSPDELILMPGSFWTELNNFVRFGELDTLEREMIQLAYVHGFLDAVALFEVGTFFEGDQSKIWELSSVCEGMDVRQIVDTINKFYKDYPQWRDLAPAAVISGVIPRLRKGLPPIPPDTTGNEREKKDKD